MTIVHSAADWTRAAWLQWHRPWDAMHGSWEAQGHDRFVAAGATEHWLRLHYAGWCACYDLPLAPIPALLSGVNADDPGWRLLALSREDFDRCLRMVGRALQFAAFPSSRLRNDSVTADRSELRWSLARAPLIPPEQARSLVRSAEGHATATWSALAAKALHGWISPLSPLTWPRLRLRCERDAVLAAESGVEGLTSSGAALCARLWRAALRASHLDLEETLS
ncbi:hypothetical protein SAMN05216359_102492 [Roseateles sp. YR242]|uniref:hypothetical protein n=1 Tax=Roseateles sp. YR242 TaxID=1855305 RepID=UPI0008CD0C85|nr:hypothetical protein [Roseateles sp. YR242]SEK63734.1 hypothetical protein SAMN05216359_102492 [Roseateles sp. YR242]